MEQVKELLKLITHAKGSGEIFKHKWLYLIDSGGQPQFHELLPTFVRHVSAAALFVKLNETLESHPMIEYYNREGILCGQPYRSSHNHLQTLQNCLQAMQSRNDADRATQCPKLFFVGTHRDIKNKKEPVESKNKILLEMLIQNDTIRENLIYYSLGKTDQLLYPVNAKKPGKADKNVAAEFRRNLMNKCNTLEHKIPIGWFVLEQLLQDLSDNGILSFNKCIEVAGRLGMNRMQLDAALNYLVKLNIFEYFPTILPKVVFTTSQVLLNKVTELVEYSHSLNVGPAQGVDSTDREFREYGRISLELLKRTQFSSHYIQGLFGPEDLLDLWVELLVVAKEADGTFVIPAVLGELSLESLSEHRLNIHSSEVMPIAVHYPGGLFPSGIFSSLISDLQNKSDWKISTKLKKPACLYKNCVEFSVSGSITANVTLIYSYDWIELHTNVFGEDKQTACLLRDALLNSLKHAEEIQKYNNLVPELAFFCPCKEGSPSSLHLASPVALDYKFMRCRRDERVCTKLTDKHTLWLKSIDASLQGGSGGTVTTKTSPQYQQFHSMTLQPQHFGHGTQHIRLTEQHHSVLLKQLTKRSTKWREIGLSLGFLPTELDGIQAKPILFTGAPTSWLSSMLSEWLQWAPGDSRESTTFATLEGLKAALREAGLGAAAHDLGV